MPLDVDDHGLQVSMAVFDNGTIGLEHLSLPGRGAGEIDVEIAAAAICGSDLHTVLGDRPAPPRAALGHEAVGRVLSVDEGTTDLRGAPLGAGDRIAMSMMSTCGGCDRCRVGLSMKCRSLMKYGHESVSVSPHATGMLADRVRLTPTVPVLNIPDDIDDLVMVSAGCAVATAAAVVEAAEAHIGDSVLVFGAGALGYYCAAMLVSIGCHVRVREPSGARAAALQGTGAWIDEGDGDPPRIVVEASGNSGAFGEAVTAAEVGGHVVAAGSVSPGSSTTAIDPAMLVTRRVRLTGVHNYSAENFRWAVDWLLSHGRHLDLAALLSPIYPLAQIDEAFAEMARGTYTRVVVGPSAA